MDKFRLETSIQFPFFKMRELVTYSEVKKPSGVAYILLVLINESKDRKASLSNLLENFGVPKNLQYIFADELEKLIYQDILSCDGFYKNEFETYSIGYFRFTEKGKKIFAEESIPTGVNKEAKIAVFYNIAKNELSLAIDPDLEPKPLMDCALTPEFVSSFECNKDVEAFLNLNKGKRGVDIKKEEIITKVETVGEHENWTAKYDCDMEINRDNILINFNDDTLQKFAEAHYNNEIFTTSMAYKNRFKFKSEYATHISLNLFASEKIQGILIPKEIDDVLKQKFKLLFTKGNYQSSGGLVYSDNQSMEGFNKYIEFIQVDIHDSIYGYVPGTFDFKCEKFGIITIPLVLKLKIESDELRGVAREYLSSRTAYSDENFKTLVRLTDVTKDYDLAYSIMDGYMKDNNETNLVCLNEIKSLAVTNPNILSKHKELMKSNFVTYLHNATEANIETVLKITQSIPKYIGYSQDETLKALLGGNKEFSNKVKTFELLLDSGFSKELVTLYLNPVPELFKKREAKNKVLLDLLNFDGRISSLKQITGIQDYKTYTFDEESLDTKSFKSEYSTAYSLFKNISFFKNGNENLFTEYEGFMGVFGLINDHINMVEDALKNPKNIKRELIEKKIVSGDYQFVFVNLAAKLEMILKNKCHLEGKLSGMLSEARRSGIIDKKIISDLHDFRENRNAFVHPEDRTANFTPDDLRRWSDEIFDLEEDEK